MTVSGEDRVGAHIPEQKTMLYMHQGACFIYVQQQHSHTHSTECEHGAAGSSTEEKPSLERRVKLE